MQASYDEIRRMSHRALDAGGVAAGVDEDSAHAVAWLEAAGLPGLAVLATALDGSDPAKRGVGLECVPPPSASLELDAEQSSTVFFAASVIDLLVASTQSAGTGQASLTLHSARHPVMLIASGARFCPDGAEILVTWNGVVSTVRKGSVFLSENGPSATEWYEPREFDVNLSCTSQPDLSQTPAGASLSGRLGRAFRDGIEVDDSAYSRVADYADEILVPESDVSRLSGAGAGLTDND